MNHVIARLRVRLRGLIEEEHGQDLIEVALIFLAIILVIMALFPPFAADLNTMFSSVATGI
jgi:Flp pilus assembly pilin Flp